MSYTLEKLYLLANMIEYAPIFFFRRIKLKAKKVDLIIIDMDGTITSIHTFKEALKHCYNQQGEDIYLKSIFQKKRNNFSADNQRMLKAIELLKQGGLQKNYEKEILKKALKSVNNKLLIFLRKNCKNKDIIIVSKSSNWMANNLAKKLKFSDGFGSELIYNKNGLLIDSKMLVTDTIPKNIEINIFTTKEIIAETYMKKRGKDFDLNKVALMTNDVLDIKLLSRVGIAILLKKENPQFLDKLAIICKIYDIEIDKDYNKLKGLIN